MNCYYHPDRESNHTCTECGKAVCNECMVASGDRIICNNCEEELRSNINYEYSRRVARFLSCIPGVGHMYLGLMERGLMLLASVAGIIALINITNSEILPFGIAILWFYSMFDAYHLRRKIREGELIIQHKININRTYLAYGFIGIGSVILINIFLNNYIRTMFTYAEMQRMRSIVFPLILIIVGIAMIIRIKKNAAEADGQEEMKELN